MNKTPLLFALAVVVASTAWVCDAAAGERGRTLHRNAQGGQWTAHRSNAFFNSQRQGQWQADGHGNASGSRSGSFNGAHGTDAGYQHSAYRHADGSAGRQRSAYFNGPDGATVNTSGHIDRDAAGDFDGSRTTTITGRDGNSYRGSTSVSNGTVTYTGTCSNAAGEVIGCRR